MQVTQIKVGHERTVFQEPYCSEKYSVELMVDVSAENLSESENIQDAIEQVKTEVYEAVSSFIERFAPNVKPYEDLRTITNYPASCQQSSIDLDIPETDLE